MFWRYWFGGVYKMWYLGCYDGGDFIVWVCVKVGEGDGVIGGGGGRVKSGLRVDFWSFRWRSGKVDRKEKL